MSADLVAELLRIVNIIGLRLLYILGRVPILFVLIRRSQDKLKVVNTGEWVHR